MRGPTYAYTHVLSTCDRFGMHDFVAHVSHGVSLPRFLFYNVYAILCGYGIQWVCDMCCVRDTMYDTLHTVYSI